VLNVRLLEGHEPEPSAPLVASERTAHETALQPDRRVFERGVFICVWRRFFGGSTFERVAERGASDGVTPPP
jgi:hypothetical protein